MHTEQLADHVRSAEHLDADVAASRFGHLRSHRAAGRRWYCGGRKQDIARTGQGCAVTGKGRRLVVNGLGFRCGRVLAMVWQRLALRLWGIVPAPGPDGKCLQRLLFLARMPQCG